MWVAAFPACGLFRVPGPVSCVAAPADVDVFEYPVLRLFKLLCHIGSPILFSAVSGFLYAMWTVSRVINGPCKNVGMEDLLLFSMAEVPVFFIPLYVTYLLLKGREKESVFMFATVLVSWMFSYGLGFFYYHPVPGGAENAFPSQHATVMFAALYSVVYYKRSKAAIVFGAAVASTSLGRLSVDLHYPIDIAGGALAGLIGFTLVYLLEDQLEHASDQISDLRRKLIRVVKG